MSKRRKRPAPWHPRVWGAWILVAFGWLLAQLPLRTLFEVGALFGALAYRLGGSRRHITRVNVALCFPELSGAAQDALVREVFRHTGVALVELLLAWLDPKRPIAQRCTIHGLEHLRAAAAQGHGVLLVGAHFSCIDIMAQPLAQAVDLDVVYRRNRNPVWEWLQVRGRRHYFDGVIERDDVRGMLRRLEAGRIIWYAADQDYGRRHSVFAPFFGIPAATINATARLARVNDSPVLFMYQHRDLDSLTWEAHIGPPLDGYPSGDDVADATRINALIEAAVRLHPAQYLWLHRRFKTRPPGEPRLY